MADIQRRFYISLVGPDGQPVYYGQGALLQNDNSEVSTYSLAPGTGGFRVMEDGLYQLIVNPLLKQVNIVPFNFRLTSKFELTEDGENELFLQNRLTTILTMWLPGCPVAS